MYKRIHDREGREWLWPIEDVECFPAVIDEVSKLDKVVELCKARNIAVQAGGNGGIFPRKLSGMFKYVYTFEPDTANFACLIHNVPEQNVYKFPCAVGAAHAGISLEGDRRNCGAYQVADRGVTPTLKIDDLSLPACDLIYLDVEGYEFRALMGASTTIKQYKPVIAVEQKGLGQRYGPENLPKLLSDMGYQKVARYGNDDIYTCTSPV
jgi:FkbM family methyltransferase